MFEQMVTRGYYDDEETPPFRRHGSRGHEYLLSHDRELPSATGHGRYSGPRNHHLSTHERRNMDSPADQDSNSRPRSRIPVACGRCRKRKIRCSGDNGGPCSNCKSAGNDQCQFLRVSSTEAQLKNDDTDFGYDPAAASRLNCRLVPFGPQSYAPQSAVNTDSYQYRASSISTYQYPVRSYYNGMPSFTEFADENVDYGIQGSSYNQLMGPEHLAIPSSYGTPGTGRGWTPSPQISKSNSLFLEQEPAYNQGLPYQSSGYLLRPSTSPESKGVSGNAMTVPLPTPINGNDRVLPYPTANRPAQLGTLLRSSDSVIPVTHAGFQSYNGLISSNMFNSAKSANNNAVTDNASLSSSYIPMSSASPESSSSSQLAYSSNGHHLSQSSNDMYASSPHESLFHPNDSSNSAYGPSTTASKRGSQSSQATDDESSMPPLSANNLSNGHAYIPYNSQSTYPAPPMDLHPAAPPQRRVSAVQAS